MRLGEVRTDSVMVRCGRVETVLPGRAFVRLERGEICAACAAHGSCRAGPVESKEPFVEVLDPIGVQQGDRVEIRFSEAALWSGLLWGILVPVGAMVGGATAGWSLGPHVGWSSTAAAAVVGFSALAAAFGMGVLVHGKKGGSRRYLPEITRALGKCPPEDVSSGRPSGA